MKRTAALRHPATLAVLCLSGVAAGAAGGGGATQPEPAKIVTFIEVRSDAVDQAKVILRQHESALRQRDARLQIETLEEIGRPERFVLLESATHPDELTYAEAGAPQTLTPLAALLTAPPDRRTNREFHAKESNAQLSSAPSPAQTRASLSASQVLYVVTHLDLAPVDQARGIAALQRLVDAARLSPGNLRFEAWQQANRPNHFNLVAIWNDRASLDEFTRSAAAGEYRAIVAPLIGSPYDERLYRRINAK